MLHYSALSPDIQALARGEKSAPISPTLLPPLPKDAQKPVSLEQEMAAFTLADGYEINLFGSEELDVAKPTPMPWDERGRLYVACKGRRASKWPCRLLKTNTTSFIDYALRQTVRSLQTPWQAPFQANQLNFHGNVSQMEYVRKIASAAPVATHPGQAVYEALCLNCHQTGGKGLPEFTSA